MSSPQNIIPGLNAHGGPMLASAGKIIEMLSAVPTDATAGYAAKCLLLVPGSGIYQNEGSQSSCSFKKIASITETATLTGKTLTSPTITTPTITGATITGTFTETDFVNTEFNPYTRIWVRSDFTKTLTKASVMSASYIKSNLSFDQDWIISGSGGAAILGFTGINRSDGGVFLNHSSNSSTYVFMKPAKSGRLSKIAWSTSKAPRFRAVIKTGSVVASNKIVMGLYSGSVRPARFINAGTNTKNRFEVHYNNRVDSNWRANAVASTVTSSSASLSLVVAASTIYDIELRVSAARIPSVYINNTLVKTFTSALKATTRLVPIIGLQTEDDDDLVSTTGIALYHTMLSQNIS